MAFTPIFETGFEMGSVYCQDTIFTNGYSIDTTNPKTGTYCMAHSPAGSGNYIARWKLPSATDDLYGGIWVDHRGVLGRHMMKYYLNTAASGNYIMLVLEGNHWNAYVNATPVAYGNEFVHSSSYHNLQFHIIIGDSGTIETIVDGVPDIVYNGDTKPGTETQIGSWAVENDSIAIFYDDICFGTGGWPGGRKYEKLTLNADHLAEWTPSAAADHYTLVDEVPYNDTDNVSTLLTAQTDLYGHSGWSSTGKVPTSMVVWLAIQKIESDTSQILFTIHEGATTLQSPATDINTSTQVQGYSFTTAADASAWDDTHIDATFVGMESII